MGRKVQRDEIGFHNLLHQIREERAISRTMLRYGLFSDSEMHYIESGERLPDYLTRNRLMARLGVSAEGYEDFLQPSEYQRYLLSLELMDAVEHRMTGTAQERLVEMFKTCDSQSKLEKQFLLDMRGRIARQSGLPPDVISEIYEEAISLTVPDIDYHHLEKYVLAPEEYYYIFCWLDAFESRRDILPIIKAVLAHMLMRNLESITLSKVLPKGAELYARCVIENESSNVVLLKHALGYLTEALSVLRKHHRLYYIEEVLEVRRQLLDALRTTGDYQEQIDENFRLLGAIKWLYSEYDIGKTMEDDCYIYRSSEVYSIADVIKGRRRQIGYSRDDLASGICSARTLMRIENSQTDSQWGIIKELFERLGISGVYRRTEFIGNSHSMANLYEKYRFLSSNRQYSDAEEVLEEIKKRVDDSYIQNRQSIARMQLRKRLRDKEITPEKFCQMAWEHLFESYITKENAFAEEGYLTIVERVFLYNIVITGEKQAEYESYIERRGNVVNTTNDIPQYELGMTWYVSEMGNQKMYEKANEKTDCLIKTCLQRGRGAHITENLFGILWNDAMQHNDYHTPNYLTKLMMIRDCAVLLNTPYIKNFLEGRLALFRDGKNWTV